MIGDYLDPSKRELSSPQRQIRSTVQALIARHGRLDAQTLAQALGWLPPTAPPMGSDQLAEALASWPTASAVLSQARALALDLGLVPSTGISDPNGLRELIEACSLIPAMGPMQLDLFVDTRIDSQRHALRRAIADLDLDLARSLVDAQCGDNANLPKDLQRLLELFEARSDLTEQRAGAKACAIVEQSDHLAALAHVNLGGFADEYLRLLWTALAKALDGQAFQPQQPRQHRSYVLRLLGDWAAMRASIEAEADWCTQAGLLHEHVFACECLADHRAAMSDWLLICQSAADDAELQLANSTLLGPAWAEFADNDPALDLALFPAWCVICHGLNFPPAPMQNDSLTARALSAAQALRSDLGNIKHRAALQKIAPALLPFALRRVPGPAGWRLSAAG